MNEWKKIWQDFWFEPLDVRGYCLFRVAVGFLLIYSIGHYIFHFDAWIMDSPELATGVLDYLAINRIPWSIFRYVESGEVGLWILCLMMIPLVLFTLGVGGRVTALLTWILFLSIGNHNPSLQFGFDEYTAVFLPLFVIYPGMSHFSIASFWGKKRPDSNLIKGLGVVMIRTFQILFVFRYFAAGLYKPNDIWSDGAVIWQLLNNYEFQKIDFSIFHEYWGVLGWVSISVKVFELLFLPLIMYKPTRKIAIIYGLMMHLGIGLTTPLMSFSLLMMACYFVFLPEDWIEKVDRTVTAGVTSRHVND